MVCLNKYRLRDRLCMTWLENQQSKYFEQLSCLTINRRLIRHHEVIVVVNVVEELFVDIGFVFLNLITSIVKYILLLNIIL